MAKYRDIYPYLKRSGAGLPVPFDHCYAGNLDICERCGVMLVWVIADTKIGHAGFCERHLWDRSDTEPVARVWGIWVGGGCGFAWLAEEAREGEQDAPECKEQVRIKGVWYGGYSCTLVSETMVYMYNVVATRLLLCACEV
jgi:hypothetical protein